jgi:hypothetical protein
MQQAGLVPDAVAGEKKKIVHDNKQQGHFKGTSLR